MAKKSKPPVIHKPALEGWKQIIRDVFDGTDTREENIQKILNDAEAGRVSKMKDEQLKMSGSTRRKA